MRRCVAASLALALFGACLGCGAVNVTFTSKFSQASGYVSVVHLTVVDNGDGTSTTITAVTLLSSGAATTHNFCGNVVSQFPVNSWVTARFTPGTACGTLISVTLRG